MTNLEYYKDMILSLIKNENDSMYDAVNKVYCIDNAITNKTYISEIKLLEWLADERK